MAFGIYPISDSISARCALFGTMLVRACQRVAEWIPQSRQRHAMTELNDQLFRDIGVIPQRDIRVNRREAAAREAAKLFWHL